MAIAAAAAVMVCERTMVGGGGGEAAGGCVCGGKGGFVGPTRLITMPLPPFYCSDSVADGLAPLFRSSTVFEVANAISSRVVSGLVGSNNADKALGVASKTVVYGHAIQVRSSAADD